MHAPTPSDIRAARAAASLTQSEAAALLHTSLRSYQQWEAGDRRMHPAMWELFSIKVASAKVEVIKQRPRRARAELKRAEEAHEVPCT